MLRKETIQAFLKRLATLAPEEVEAYAKQLAFEDYAPAFCELALRPLCPLLDSRVSPPERPWHGEMKTQLERGWWEHTGNALVEALLAYGRLKPPNVGRLPEDGEEKPSKGHTSPRQPCADGTPGLEQAKIRANTYFIGISA